MITKRRQHFLPVVYLKHFSLDSGRPSRTSKLWRFDGTASKRVTAESQCFEAWFYSVERANEAEQMFEGLETAYGGCMRKITARQRSTQRDYIALILVMFDLHLRNSIYENSTGREELDAYFTRLSWLRAEIAERQDAIPTDAEVFLALKDHWRVQIIDVANNHQFITSDNPSMWFTLGRADHVLDCVILPVSPFSLAVSVDRRYVEITGSRAAPRDVEVLNRDQCYRAHRCIFTAQKLDKEEENSVAKSISDRPNGRPRTEAVKGEVDTLGLQNGMITFLQVKG